MDRSVSTEAAVSDRLGALPPEERVLCLAARRHPDEVAVERLRLDLARGIDWERLWELGQRHEVLALLAVSLPGAVGDLVPPDWAGRAMRRRHATLRGNAELADALMPILDGLDAAGVPVMPVKGLALTERLYGDLASRPCADIDILVPESRLGDAGAVLRGLGFRQRAKPGYKALVHRFHEPAWGRGQGPEHVRVELHWALWAGGADRLTMEGLWDRSVTTTLLGRPIRSLGSEDMLLHLAIHRSRSALRLRWLVDIAELVAQDGSALDWDAFLSRAAPAGARTTSSMVLTMAADLLGAPVPPHVLDRLAIGLPKRAILERTCGTTALFRTPKPGDTRQQPHWSYRAFEEDGAGRIVASLTTSAARPLREALHDAGILRVRRRAPAVLGLEASPDGTDPPSTPSTG